ncbi:MAG TPA: NYN domain-containing protein, partial [Gemmatimonadales bacterium]|nr:NYN domain-containing protein [Gemmatimonadales bacterium]
MTQPPQAHLPRPVHHEPPAHAPNAALMIDFDNVTMGIRSDLQSELRRLLQSDIIKGKVAVQRAYADWRRYPQYIVPLAESSIDMIWAPAYGSNKKNATDIRLAVDALELVFTRPEIGTFILLSGDSDFSSLVLKLKEYGKYVIGVGIRESSSDLLIQNCDEYYSYNELAGLTKESDVTHERHDPWDLVIEAVKQMTAHSDVMRSDRLKQVMQEIDPTFNEKDLGFSRFSKFVVEAAHKGLIALNKLDNGQYEIGLGPGVPGAAAQPAGVAAFDRPRERGEGRGRGRRGRGSRDEREGREEHAVADEPPALPPAREERRGAFSLDGAFGLIKQAIGRLGGESRPVSAQELGEAMAEIKGDEEPVEPAQVQKLLRQAHDRELIDLAKEEDGAYSVKLRDATPPADAPPAEPAAVADADEALDPPMPESSAPPSMRPANPPAVGIPSRSARFRRGSRGPRVAPPEIPKIGVVEMDPNFKPRI